MNRQPDPAAIHRAIAEEYAWEGDALRHSGKSAEADRMWIHARIHKRAAERLAKASGVEATDIASGRGAALPSLFAVVDEDGRVHTANATRKRGALLGQLDHGETIGEWVPRGVADQRIAELDLKLGACTESRRTILEGEERLRDELVDAFVPEAEREGARTFPLARTVQHAIEHHAWHHDAQDASYVRTVEAERDAARAEVEHWRGEAERRAIDVEVLRSPLDQQEDERRELKALRAEVAELRAEADKEATRWQNRIADVIKRNGLEPFDASGNESGDPLDWSADQVHHALVEMQELVEDAQAKLATARREALEEAAALVEGSVGWAHRTGYDHATGVRNECNMRLVKELRALATPPATERT